MAMAGAVPDSSTRCWPAQICSGPSTRMRKSVTLIERCLLLKDAGEGTYSAQRDRHPEADYDRCGEQQAKFVQCGQFERPQQQRDTDQYRRLQQVGTVGGR